MIKTILCIFDGGKRELNALNMAFLMAKKHRAQLRILHVSPQPATYSGVIYGENIISLGAIIESIEAKNKQLAQETKEIAFSAAKKHGLFLDGKTETTSSALFIHAVGAMGQIIAQEGRLCDLIIFCREATPSYDLTVTALFKTARPVLLMPPAQDKLQHKNLCKTISFAWNGSLEASRALYNALPLLEEVSKLHILTVQEKPSNQALQGNISDYLASHQIVAEKLSFVSGQHRTTAESLLMHARKLNTDLLIMGAYHHSMLKEMVLGGVTEHMLNHADIPLLISH